MNFSKFSLLLGLIITFLMVGCSRDDYNDSVGENNPVLPLSNNGDSYIQSQNNTLGESGNLLLNGGFEEWVFMASYSIPKNWLNHNNNNMKSDYKVVYEGKYSARLSSLEKGSTARVDQVVRVIPGHKIRLRFRYYIEKWKAQGARTYCYFRTESAEAYTISADVLKSFYDTNTYRIIRGGGYGRTYFTDMMNVWQTFDETIEVPPSANYFVFGVNSYFGTTIYVDACSVTDATQSGSTGIRHVKM